MEQLLLFRLGEQLFGLQVANLQEIVDAPPLFYIPMAPSCVCGAMNFHGQIVPVLDLPGYLGIPGSIRDRRIIVLAEHLCSLAFTAMAVLRIIPFDPEALLPADSQPYVRGRFDREGETVHLLDAAGLVASLEMREQRRK